MASTRMAVRCTLGCLLLSAACQAVAGIQERSLEEGLAETIAGVSAECEAYCATLEKGCTDDLSQYRSTVACLVVCEHLRSFPASPEADRSNTLECRSAIVESVAEPSDCDEGGPSGGEVCGTKCESYCLLRKKVCSDDFEKCMEGCPILRDAPMRLSATHAFDGGDTLQCRFAHISAAAQSLMEGNLRERTRHCAHSEINVLQADARHGRPCNDKKPNCEQYCQLVQKACPMNSRYAQYEDDAQCQAVCKIFSEGTKDDVQNQNTLGCRIFQAYATVSEGLENNCSEAGPAGGGMVGCGENCLGYCTLLSRACADGFATNFGDLQRCQTDCAALDTGELYSITNSAKPLPCRIRSAAQAIALDEGPARAQLCRKALGQSACP